MKNIASCFRLGLMILVALLSSASITHADGVATVTFTGVPADCGFSVGPCSGNNPDAEVWSGTFSIDLTTGALLSYSITSTGPGLGPWIGPPVGSFFPACLTTFTEGCNITWSDAAGWSLQWDPSNFGESVLNSVGDDFFGMGLFNTFAATYSVTVSPEPPTILLLGVGLAVTLIWRSRRAVSILE